MIISHHINYYASTNRYAQNTAYYEKTKNRILILYRLIHASGSKCDDREIQKYLENNISGKYLNAITNHKKDFLKMFIF